MPRRIPDYPVIFYGWNHLASIGSYTTLTGALIFFYAIVEGVIKKPQKATKAAIAH